MICCFLLMLKRLAGADYPFGFGINGSCSDCPPSDCPHPQCGAGQRLQDERMLPLYREMSALYPSLYITHPSDWNTTDLRHNRQPYDCPVTPARRPHPHSLQR
eukprot:SAG11_NODE_1282_length_5310_cov_24.980426_3_plen_103_part_00